MIRIIFACLSHQVCLFMLCAALVGDAASAKIALQAEALRDVVPAGYARVASHGTSAAAIDIAFGDPLGLRLVLVNESDHATDPVPLSFNPRTTPAIVVIRHPNGHESQSPLCQPNVRARPPIRRMEPRESVTEYLYAYTDAAAEAEGHAEYLFPEPGEYSVYVQYNAQAGVVKTDQQGERLRSNTIRVTVGPPFPGWDELREAGLVAAVRTGSFALLRPEFNKNWRKEIDRLDELVEKADRPWLTQFYAKRRQEALRSAQEDESQDAPEQE